MQRKIKRIRRVVGFWVLGWSLNGPSKRTRRNHRAHVQYDRYLVTFQHSDTRVRRKLARNF